MAMEKHQTVCVQVRQPEKHHRRQPVAPRIERPVQQVTKHPAHHYLYRGDEDSPAADEPEPLVDLSPTSRCFRCRWSRNDSRRFDSRRTRPATAGTGTAASAAVPAVATRSSSSTISISSPRSPLAILPRLLLVLSLALSLSWSPIFLCGAQILQDPSSVTITDGEWAVFTCAVNCSNGPVAWYLETETERVAINLFIHRDIEGVQYSLSGMDYCNSEEENYTSVLSISGSPRVDRLPLQCSTVCTSSLCSCDQPPNVFNSLIAVLYVKEREDVDVVLPTPSPTQLPVPSSTQTSGSESHSSSSSQQTSSMSHSVQASLVDQPVAVVSTQVLCVQESSAVEVASSQPSLPSPVVTSEDLELQDYLKQNFLIGFPAGVVAGLFMGIILVGLFCLCYRSQHKKQHKYSINHTKPMEERQMNVYVTNSNTANNSDLCTNV